MSASAGAGLGLAWLLPERGAVGPRPGRMRLPPAWGLPRLWRVSRYQVIPVLALLLASPLAAQGTTRLLGRVVNVAGNPVRDVRLRIVGQGEPEITDSGEFQLEVSSERGEVEVTVIEGGLEVLYPLHGRLAVPADASTRVTVVVGEPERTYINDLLATRFVQLEATLKRNGVSYDASVDSLSAEVRQVIQLLKIREEDLRQSIELQKRQSDIKPELLRTIDAYVLELKDLRDAFELVVPYAPANVEAVKTLQRAMADYSAAFEALNNNRNAYLSGIRSYWAEAQAEGLRRDLDDVYTDAIEDIHRGYVLPLNDALVTIQAAWGLNRPGKDRIAAAIATAQRVAQELEPRINVLAARYARLREALERD